MQLGFEMLSYKHSCFTWFNLFFTLLLGRLHEVLMDLQRKQLDQLSDWLTVTEERIRKMDTKSYGDDFETFKKQIEEHKVCKKCVICVA